MAVAYKNLGQSSPAAGTLADVYTVPGATAAVLSSIVVANRDTAAATFRLSHAVAGAADAVAQYLAYDVAVGGGQSYVLTIGATMAATDKLRGQSSNGLCSFNVYGQERS